MVETVTINKAVEAPNLSLEQEAANMGIDPKSVDPTAKTQSAPERPSWLPPKFKSAEELAASYAELEKKLGGNNKSEANPEESNVQEEGEPNPEEKTTEEQTPEEQAKELVDKAGLNFDEMSSQYWEKGELSKDHYDALDKAGIPKVIVDQFIEGQQALIQAARTTVFNEVGGETKYQSMLEWAGKNYSEAEVAAYNAAVNGNDKNAMLLAVKGLKGRFEATVGFEPTRTLGGRTTPTADKYDSIAQMQKDMGDPRYKTDPAFRQKVAAKLQRSSIL